ncbi:MAG: low molecular weight phosphotyrosine protein phosphatase [Ruminococcaceae bacterium]|nr:low molecular weight phosphotyrosine protein phosphatase [Oscillospiraceae bacterium]
MIKILFICHGNICRSPMAEFVMKELVEKKNLKDKFVIASAATSNEEIGNPVYPPVRRLLSKRGISTEGKRAVRVTKGDYGYYDYLICMDKNNLRNLSFIIGNDTQNKVYRLLDFTSVPDDVADPWYTGDFEATERDVNNGCEALLDYIIKNNNI